MSPIDFLLVLVRWLHLTSAAIWIGGSIFFLLVVQSKTENSGEFGRINKFGILSEFNYLSDLLISTLLVSGMILTVNRLTIGTISSLYITVLVFKIFLSLWLFSIVWIQRGFKNKMHISQSDQTNSNSADKKTGFMNFIGSHRTIVPVGLIIFLVSDALKIIFESI